MKPNFYLLKDKITGKFYKDSYFAENLVKSHDATLSYLTLEVAIAWKNKVNDSVKAFNLFRSKLGKEPNNVDFILHKVVDVTSVAVKE